jgi:hypothetical protein
MNSQDQDLTMPVEVVDAPSRYPRAIGRQPITNARTVREEMCRVYRAVATGKVEAKNGNSMVYMLSQILKAIEVEQIESKLDAVIQDQQSRTR